MRAHWQPPDVSGVSPIGAPPSLPISHISCGGDILTSAQLWAQTVNSRFSMAKHYHVFSAAEACKHCWLGVGGFSGLVRSILVFQRKLSLFLSLSVSLSQPGMRGLWPGHCWRDYPCIKYRCRHLSHSRSLPIARTPTPPTFLLLLHPSSLLPPALGL